MKFNFKILPGALVLGAVACLQLAFAQVDSVWQAYYDSSLVSFDRAELHASIDWLEKATGRLETLEPDEYADSCHHLILSDLSSCYYYLGDFPKAIQVSQRVIDYVEREYGRDQQIYGDALLNLAATYIQVARYEHALSLFNTVLENYENNLGKEHLYYGLALSHLALLHDKLGNVEEAVRRYEETRYNFETNLGTEHDYYLTTIHNLGLLYQGLGRYEEALKLFRSSLMGETEPGYSRFGRIKRINSIGSLYYMMGRYDLADSVFNSALDLLERRDLTWTQEYATVLNNLAALYRDQGRYEDALVNYGRSLEIYEATLGPEHSNYALTQQGLGDAFMRMGENDTAYVLMKESIDICRDRLGVHHPWYELWINKLANLYCRMGEYDSAAAVIVEAKPNVDRQIDRVLSISSEKNKSDFISTIRSNIHKYYSYIHQMGYRTDALNEFFYDNELVLKNIVLSSTINTFSAIKREGDSTLIKDLDNWRNLKEYLSRQYAVPLAIRISDVDSVEDVVNSLEEELVRRSQVLEDDLRVLVWQDVRDKLSKDEVALEFAHYRYFDLVPSDSIFYIALLITPECKVPRAIPLFEESALSEILTSNTGLDHQDLSAFYARGGMGSDLYDLIWSKIEPLTDGFRTVYYAPSGLLHQVNFNAMSGPEEMFLGTRYEMVRLNSTRQLVGDRDRSELAGAAIFGGMEYDLAVDEQNKDSSGYVVQLAMADLAGQRSALTERFDFLPGTVHEINALESIFRRKRIPLDIKSGTAATESEFKALSGRSPKVIHLATHGFFFPDAELSAEEIKRGAAFKYIDNPMFRAGLVFSGANYAWEKGFNPYEKEDGILTAYEISNLDLSGTDLVVLSACETGLGEIRGSEGVYGLQRAFKMAGIDNLVMSLWKVPDAQTAELMERFYSNWLKGYDVRSAFRRAQQEMSERYDPYYWAAFVMVGDVVEARKPGSRIAWWIWLLTGLAFIGVIYMLNKHKR